MKREKMFTIRVSEDQKSSLLKFLTEIKKRTRYTYPEIVLTALKQHRAGLQ